MRWMLRLKAAEQGIWKGAEMRRRLAGAGLEISVGKMSAWWTGTPASIKLEELDVICAVLGCTPADLLVCEPEKVALSAPEQDLEPQAVNGPPAVPRLGRNRRLPPA